MNSTGNKADLCTPESDELEISLFGPGFGECLVIHLGDERWMIVDSCVDARTGRPAAIRYLEDIGVAYADKVAVILATHWHDDHVRGLSETVRACENARFVCSNALQTNEFLVLVESRASGTERLSPGVLEFSNVLSVLRARKAAGVNPDRVKRFVLENAIVDRSAKCEVIAMSPSTAAVEQASKAIASLLPQRLQPHLRVTAPKQNEASVALWLKGASGTALLGADLERRASDDRGWGAVVALAPEGTATLVKLPHHGGKTGHDRRMWDRLLQPRPDAMLTPWSLGGASLPTDEDRRRICALAPDAVIAGHASSKPRRYARAIERTLNEVATARRAIGDRVGHIRARCGPADCGQWRVELIHEAQHLCRAA
jgi:beta-lactamase superfamily II metal-dependent hydrolase